MENKKVTWNGKITKEEVASAEDGLRLLQEVGTTKRGAELMVDKMLFYVLKIEAVDTRAANILKQTFLSKGADAAVSANTVNLSAEKTDVLIFATKKQILESVERLREQPWGLKKIASELEKWIK